MMLFSNDYSCFVTERGHLMLGAVGESHNEELDTYILVDMDSIPDLYNGSTVLEKPPFAAESKWKPKSVVYNKEEGTFVITDPMHQITVNDRKKYVKGVVEGRLTQTELLKLVRESAKEAFFELSMEPISSLRTSKGMKRYNNGLNKWRSFCSGKYDVPSLMLEANQSYYTMIPEGVISGKI